MITEILTDFGKKLTDKWLTLLVPTGVLYIGVLIVTWTLRPSTSGAGLPDRVLAGLIAIGDWTLKLKDTPTRLVLLLFGLLVASAAASLTAIASGSVVRRWWLAEPPFGILLFFSTKLRGLLWRAIDRKALTDQRFVPVRNAIGLARPTRPTWMGDRAAQLQTRIRNEYGLDVVSSWPRLWHLVPDSVRTEFNTAVTASGRAFALAGWSVLYAIAAVVFAGLGWTAWPLWMVCAGCLVAAWSRARSAIRSVMTTTEAAYDLYATELSTKLGTAITPQTGEVINEHLRKGA
jgi:hypothetical protein